MKFSRSSYHLYLLLGALFSLPTSVIAAGSGAGEEVLLADPLPPTPDPTAATTSIEHTHQQPIFPIPKSEQLENQAEAEKLVAEARRILRSLDPDPKARSKDKEGLVRTLWDVAKGTILWHKAERVEESRPGPEMRQWVGGKHGQKLMAAVERLEKAKGLVWSEDAIFLLAEMNFYGNWSHPRNYPEAFRLYKELADTSGNHTAQNMVGFMYATGVGGSVERDQAKALLYHTFAALNGNTRSEMTVAFRHYTGIATPRHCEQAAFFYHRVAKKAIRWYESGPPGGQHLTKHTYRLADDNGGVYGEGASAISSGPNGLRKHNLDAVSDVGDIVEYLELLAKKNNIPETFSLGKLYYDGSRGLPRNLSQARKYFQDVARQYWARDGSLKTLPAGQTEKWGGLAAGYLGTMALRGEGGPQDFKQANIWFKRGLQLGDVNSYNGLGYMYLYGYGVKKDIEKATEYFKAASSHDFPTAHVNIGKLLLKHNEIEKAKRYFDHATRHRDVEAFYYLAEINMSNNAKDRNCGLATVYYKIVAEKVENLQSPMAWANAAYERGDKESALIGYMMAAEQGYESGQANAAYLLDQEKSALPLPTLLLPPEKRPQPSRSDQELALIYWTRSAKQANIDSLVKMGDYYLKGIGTDVDPEKAVQCYSAASEHQPCSQALWNLGWMHENGIGMTKDFHLAKRNYDAALEAAGEAYLPVTLALLKLRVRSFWNTVTHGGVPGIGISPQHPQDPSKPKLTFFQTLKSWYHAATAPLDPEPLPDPDDILANYENRRGQGDEDDDDYMPGDDFFGDDYGDEDLTESLIILGLAGAVAVLIYYRQWRAQTAARRRRDDEVRRARAEGREPPPVVQQQEGLGLGVNEFNPNGIWGDGMPGWGMPH